MWDGVRCVGLYEMLQHGMEFCMLMQMVSDDSRWCEVMIGRSH